MKYLEGENIFVTFIVQYKQIVITFNILLQFEAGIKFAEVRPENSLFEDHLHYQVQTANKFPNKPVTMKTTIFFFFFLVAALFALAFA